MQVLIDQVVPSGALYLIGCQGVRVVVAGDLPDVQPAHPPLIHGREGWKDWAGGARRASWGATRMDSRCVPAFRPHSAVPCSGAG